MAMAWVTWPASPCTAAKYASIVSRNPGTSVGHWLGPWNGSPRRTSGWSGGEVVADPVALLEVALLLLVGVEVLHADVEPAPVAVGLLDGHLRLLLPWELEEAARLGEGAVDELLVDAVAGQVGEPNVAEGAGQLERGLPALVGVAGPERGEVDDGDLLDRDALGVQGRWDL